MISFEDRGGQVVLTYRSDWRPVSWVDDKLSVEGEATLSRTFTVRSADLLPVEEDDDGDARAFVIGSVDDEYRTIRDDVLGLKHDLRISKSIGLSRKLFVAEQTSRSSVESMSLSIRRSLLVASSNLRFPEQSSTDSCMRSRRRQR